MYSFLPGDEGFLGLETHEGLAESAGVVLLPVPFEGISSFGQGSARGPAEILQASHQVEVYDTGLGFEPYAAANGIATLAPLQLGEADGAATAELVEGVVQYWLENGKRVVTLGGAHTSVVGAIRAHVGYYPALSVVQLDAHSDLRPSYEGHAWSHACAMARVLDCQCDLVQVGVRSECREERRIAEARSLSVFRAEALSQQERDGLDWIADVVEATSDRVYVTLDCDVLDPSLIPATGTPEPGGLTWQQVDALLARLCTGREVVGFDVSELAPIDGLRHPQFTIAKLIYRLIGRMCAGKAC